MIDLASYSYPKGLHLLKSWQAGTAEAKAEIKSVFDAGIAGDFDEKFSVVSSFLDSHNFKFIKKSNYTHGKEVSDYFYVNF